MGTFLFACSLILILLSSLFIIITFSEEMEKEDLAPFSYFFAFVLLVFSVLTAYNNCEDFENHVNPPEKEYYIESVCYNYDYNKNTTIFFTENGYYETEGKYTFNKRYVLEMNNNKTNSYQDDYIVDVFESDNVNKIQINENKS